VFRFLAIGSFLRFGCWCLELLLPHSKTGVMKRYGVWGHGICHAVNVIAKRSWVGRCQALLHTFVMPAEAGLVPNPHTACRTTGLAWVLSTRPAKRKIAVCEFLFESAVPAYSSLWITKQLSGKTNLRWFFVRVRVTTPGSANWQPGKILVLEREACWKRPTSFELDHSTSLRMLT